MNSITQPYLWNERAAHAKLEDIVWPRGPVCPRCGAANRIGAVTGKGARIGLKFCGHCHRQFRATMGTMFERSHVPLHKWFQACFLLAASNHMISAHRLHLRLEVTSQTAASMLRRLERAIGGVARDGFAAGLAPADSRWTESLGHARTRRWGSLPARRPVALANGSVADVSERDQMPWTHSSINIGTASGAGFMPAPTRQFLGFVEMAQAFDYPDGAPSFDAVLARVGRRRLAEVAGE